MYSGALTLVSHVCFWQSGEVFLRIMFPDQESELDNVAEETRYI